MNYLSIQGVFTEKYDRIFWRGNKHQNIDVSQFRTHVTYIEKFDLVVNEVYKMTDKDMIKWINNLYRHY